MARAYTVAAAALALNSSHKWVDNVLSHHEVRGVRRNQRGVQRRIPPESILILAIARELYANLGLPVARALKLAHDAVETAGADLRLSRMLTLRIDVATVAAELRDRLDHAAEIAAVPRRGRRPKRRADTG